MAMWAANEQRRVMTRCTAGRLRRRLVDGLSACLIDELQFRKFAGKFVPKIRVFVQDFFWPDIVPTCAPGKIVIDNFPQAKILLFRRTRVGTCETNAILTSSRFVTNENDHRQFTH